MTVAYDSNSNVYTVDDQGVLTITKGTGQNAGVMPNFSTNCVTDLSITDTVTSVIVSSGMTSIGNKAFNEMTSITSVTLADTVTSVGTYSFSGCTSLSSIDLGDGLTYIGNYTFQNCSSLTSIDIPDTVDTIGVTAFSGTGLTSVILPSALTSINNSVFFGCASLVSATIKANVTAIGNYVFYNCSSLTSIRMQSTTPATVGTNLCPTATNIYVPHGTGNAYKSSWSAYADQIVELADPIRKMKLMCLDKGENVTSATGNSTQTGTPTPTNPIPVISTTYYDSDGNPVELRKVGTYEDTYANGVITRNVGVKVFRASDGWTDQWSGNHRTFCYVNDSATTGTVSTTDIFMTIATPDSSGTAENTTFRYSTMVYFVGVNGAFTDTTWKAYLEEQYANGTPIIVYYPLATPTTESKTLTTKYDVKTMKPMFVKSALPDGYTEVEYIQSDGTQCIDTGFAPDNNTRVKVTANWENIGSELFGARSNGNYYELLKNSERTYYQYGTNTQYALFQYDIKVIYDIDKNVCMLYAEDGTTVIGQITASVQTFSISNTLSLFALNGADSGYSRFATAKIYDAKIYDNGVLTCDLVPCVYHYGQADAVVGMYDLVSNTFKTNSGSGNFTAGNPVTTRFKTVKAKVMMEVIQ